MKCLRPILVSENPLSNDSSQLDRFFDALRCPPHGRVGKVLTLVIIVFALWVTCLSIFVPVTVSNSNKTSTEIIMMDNITNIDSVNITEETNTELKPAVTVVDIDDNLSGPTVKLKSPQVITHNEIECESQMTNIEFNENNLLNST